MLSIITITRNDPQGFCRTVLSTQTLRLCYTGIEQIIVDGSESRIAAENELFCSTQNGLRYFRKEPNGISDAFNFGINQSNSSWLWFLNGGDELLSSMDLALFHSIISNVDTDLLIFQIKLMQRDSIVPFPPLKECFPPLRTWIPHPATLIRRSLFDRYGLFDNDFKIAMDYELWMRLYRYNIRLNMIAIPLTSYDENGISTLQIAHVNSEGRRVMKKYKKSLIWLWFEMGRAMIKQYRLFKYYSINGH